jgi:hypothetical protein
MKDTYRQLILLLGVMSILVSGLVAFNSVRDPGQQEPRAENSSVNQNTTEPFENASSSSNILVQSIGGLITLWEDFQAGQKAIAGSTGGS